MKMQDPRPTNLDSHRKAKTGRERQRERERERETGGETTEIGEATNDKPYITRMQVQEHTCTHLWEIGKSKRSREEG